MKYLMVIQSALQRCLIGSVRFYQRFISPLLGRNKCRFNPSCSQYMVLAVEKDGLWWAAARGYGGSAVVIRSAGEVTIRRRLNSTSTNQNAQGKGTSESDTANRNDEKQRSSTRS